MSQAIDNLGAHLLGRVPSKPDPQNYPLGAFLAADDGPLEHALDDLVHTPYISHKTKAWAKIITARVIAQGPTPAPNPNPPPAPVGVSWVDDDDPILDQGQTPRCVGFTGADWENALPVDDHVPNSAGDDIYAACKVIDGDNQDGSTIHSLAKVLQQRGKLLTYAFARTIDEVNQFLQQHGPICWGIGWTQSMFTPDDTGLVVPSGSDIGGHAIIQYRPFDPNTGRGRLRNHWGTSWGPLGGDFDMTIDALAERLQNGGEAMAAVEVAA